jgi:hypothetical protein
MVGFLEVDALLDGVAILSQFADQWTDLPQTERRLWTALQIAAHEAIFGNAQLQRRRASTVASCAAILLGQLNNALDAAHSEFALASMDAEYAIEVGRGGVYLRLTSEQCADRPSPMSHRNGGR